MYSIIKDRDLRSVSNRTLCSNITSSSYFVERLKLDRKLEVHNGCVNTVCWNDSGTLLLSGSDDQHLVVSDPFDGKIVTKVRSGHRSNIFCAKFLPGSQDREVVSCSGSGEIFYTDLDRDDVQDANRFSCHFGTTYKIVVVPNEASTFLSCGDDGTVRFFDLRVKTSCSKMTCEEDVIINLQNSVSSMAVDPVIPYQLAVGSADGIVRIYDRRMLKAKEKSGNPSSLICVFQSPMSKTEKRHFRITSLNYRPGAHDVLVNYSSENIYLFNTYELETTQKYSMEIPKATPNRKPPVLQDTASLSGSTDNEEMEEYLGFSAEERRGPSTLYRPIRRLRLRGDWSDTGPNARPENEGQAPTSMIMQRMSDLLTRMLNTHVNEPLAESARAPDNSSDRPSPAVDVPGNETNDSSLSVINQAVVNPTPLPSLRRRSQLEEQPSISSEGMVSPDLLYLDSSVLDRNTEEAITGAEYPQSSQQGNQCVVNSNEAKKKEDHGRDLLEPNVPSQHDHGGLESHCNPGVKTPCSGQESPIAQCDHVGIVGKKNPSNNPIFFNQSLSSGKTFQNKLTEKEKKASSLDRKFNSSASDDKRIDCVNMCEECDGSQCEYSSSQSKCGFIAKDNSRASSSFCTSQDVGHSTCTSMTDVNESESFLSSETSEVDTLALATRFETGDSQLTLNDAVSLSCTASYLSTASDLSFDSLSVANLGTVSSKISRKGKAHSSQLQTFHQDSLEEIPASLKSGNCAVISASDNLGGICELLERQSHEVEESDHYDYDGRDSPAPHSLKTVKEEVTTEYEAKEEPGLVRSCALNNSRKGTESGGKVNGQQLVSNDKDISSASFSLVESGAGQCYAGKGKGVGKSSKKAQDGVSDYGKKANTPYNDGNMKFAVLDKTVPSETSSNVRNKNEVQHPDEKDELSSLGATGGSVGLPDSADKDQTTEQANQKVPNSCLCDAVSSTSTGEFSGLIQSDSLTGRHRRAGYSLPPTGNFQLHSDEDEEDDDDAVRTRRGQPSKSHAARKIQELFRKRRHAKENARLLNLPQPKVLMKFSGHRNCRTMIKESNFYGDKYVISGSDCGRIFIWERETGNLAMYLEADKHVVNCVQPNPHLPVIASSGIDYDIKLWAPLAGTSQFDADVAHMIVQRNELMLVETRDTITVPPALMLRVLASLTHIRAGRTAATAQPEQEQQQPSDD